MIPQVGATELIILLVIILLLFGAKRIPELAKSLGSGMREFRRGAAGRNEELEEGQEDNKPSEDSLSGAGERRTSR
jgi:sec-independent protein translocase protein TatA